jgi:sulfonate transport system ATP-binding protein
MSAGRSDLESATDPSSGAAEVAEAVRVRGLVKRFGDRAVLDGLDLTIRRGEFVALLGRSGSGKSTLLRVLCGLDRDVEGESAVHGRVSVAFQQPRLLPWRAVWRNVTLGLDAVEPRQVAARALAEVRLADKADAWPRTLSGGEAQRVSLARALVREPDLLLLDEPFAALDALTRLAMHRLVTQLWERHRPAVLLVTHDVDEALALADRVLVLAAGRIAAEHVPAAERPRSAQRQAELRDRVLSDLGVDDHDVA